MQEVETYRQYAADCKRLAHGMTAKDKEILLKIADAWEQRAKEAERRQQKPGAA